MLFLARAFRLILYFSRRDNLSILCNGMIPCICRRRNHLSAKLRLDVLRDLPRASQGLDHGLLILRASVLKIIAIVLQRLISLRCRNVSQIALQLAHKSISVHILLLHDTTSVSSILISLVLSVLLV